MLLYREVWRSGQQLLGGEVLIPGRWAGQGPLVAKAVPHRGAPTLIYNAGREARVITHTRKPR